ncbi:MAG: hypothetical protein DI603_20810 [Roseateles depolymerans]|uniref:DUF3828 domain-containing protein n=1 Tax=Roseateles depolymerans TaxID=76731 RepID=A0A2W5DDT9_9BURK|nr:MAG: hypothetical protein DI603_20810 [Roseateles depolymerans]
MKRRLLTTALCLTCLYGSTTARADPATEQLAVVRALYRHFAYEAVLDSPSTDGFSLAPVQVLRRFLSPALIELLVRDRSCAAQRHEICRLDFMPLWAAQDASGMTVSLRWDNSSKRVTATLRSPGGSPVLINYRMAQHQGYWRVADIGYGTDRPSLLQLLARQVD